MRRLNLRLLSPRLDIVRCATSVGQYLRGAISSAVWVMLPCGRRLLTGRLSVSAASANLSLHLCCNCVTQTLSLNDIDGRFDVLKRLVLRLSLAFDARFGRARFVRVQMEPQVSEAVHGHLV